MLSITEKENILSIFPNIKLSYENVIYKKVLNSDYIVAIPEGKKCFAWFTSINDKMICLIMELSENKQINELKITNACFSKELSYGTILYGTVFNKLNNNFFTIEDIFSYKGMDLERITWGEKLIKINELLKKDLKQIAYNNNFIVFGLPLICKTTEDLEKKIPKLGYNIDSIQFILFNKVNNYLLLNYKQYIKNTIVNTQNAIVNTQNAIVNTQNTIVNTQNTIVNIKPNQYIDTNSFKIPSVKNHIKSEIVFNIRPDIQDDIYHLYCLNRQQTEIECGIAHIPDYNTSVLMNKLFRNIKENYNLDALEESDNEEEFENENIDKFVHLNKSYKMVCQFNYKFKKWVPIKLANQENNIITNEDIINVYKTYDQNQNQNQKKNKQK